MRISARSLLLGAGLLALPTGICLAQGADATRPERMSLAEARRTVSMLNDLYVNAVLAIHGTYVKDRGSVPAATAAKAVFKAMTEKGWPTTRWLSTTGRPLNPDHNPKDAFERDAIQALKKNQARFERVQGDQLRVATLVPLVDKSCQSCHSKDKVGDPIGGLSYTVALKGAN